MHKSHTDNSIQTFLASCLFAAALAFTTDFSRRLFGAGADAGSIFGTTLQAFFAVAAGSTFTAAGRQFITNLFKRLNLRAPSMANVAVWAGLLFFVCALCIWVFAPGYLATKYNNRGRSLETVNTRSAIDAYQHSISLWPDDADAHYNLGRMFERELKLNEAIAEYQQATTINPKYVLAYSNMGRLLIIQGKAIDALRALDSGVEASEGDPYEDVALFKNRGWANLELKFLGDAESDLNHSMQLKRTPAAECVLAKTYLRMNDEKKAASMWAMFRTDYSMHRSDLDMPKVEPDCSRLAEGKTNEQK